MKIIVSNVEDLNAAVAALQAKNIRHSCIQIIFKDFNGLHFTSQKELCTTRFREIQTFADSIEIHLTTSSLRTKASQKQIQEIFEFLNKSEKVRLLDVDLHQEQYRNLPFDLREFPQLRTCTIRFGGMEGTALAQQLRLLESSKITDLSIHYTLLLDRFSGHVLPSAKAERREVLGHLLELLKKNTYLKVIQINGHKIEVGSSLTKALLEYGHSETRQAIFDQIQLRLRSNAACSLEGLASFDEELESAKEEFREAEEVYNSRQGDFNSGKKSRTFTAIKKAFESAREEMEKQRKKLFEIAGFLLKEGVPEAGFYLAKELRVEDPIKAYSYLIAIPASSKLYKEANLMIAHLFMDKAVYRNIREEEQKRKLEEQELQAVKLVATEVLETEDDAVSTSTSTSLALVAAESVRTTADREAKGRKEVQQTLPLDEEEDYAEDAVISDSEAKETAESGFSASTLAFTETFPVAESVRIAANRETKGRKEAQQILSLDEEEDRPASSSSDAPSEDALELERQKRVISHLLLAEDRERLPYMLHDYVYGAGSLDISQENLFKDIPVGKEPHAPLFFSLDMFRRSISLSQVSQALQSRQEAASSLSSFRPVSLSSFSISSSADDKQAQERVVVQAKRETVVHETGTSLVSSSVDKKQAQERTVAPVKGETVVHETGNSLLILFRKGTRSREPIASLSMGPVERPKRSGSAPAASTRSRAAGKI